MKGEHPIDDLFARGLRDAEATPPPAVWEGIVRERNWAHITLLRLRHRWGYAMLALLLLGGGIAYFVSQEGAAGNAQPTVALAAEGSTSSAQAEMVTTPPAAQEDVDARASLQAETGTDQAPTGGALRPAASLTASSATSNAIATSQNSPAKEDKGTVAPAVTVAASVAGRAERRSSPQGSGTSDDIADTKRTNATQNAGQASTALTANVASGTTPSPNNPGKLGNDASQGISPTDAGDQALAAVNAETAVTNSGAAFTGDMRWMRTRPSLLNVALGAAPAPTVAHPEDPYVLRNKRVFIGLQLEWMSLRGEWKGTGDEVREMNRSEAWLDRKGLGVVAGLRWRSGLHVALTASASQQRSRFLRTMTIAGDTSTTLDTTWVATAAGPQTVYTWDIVPVTIAEPGVSESTSATNIYTQLRIAPELGYARRLGRWSFGGRLGPVFTATLSRKGNALLPDPVQPDDNDLPPNPPIVIPANDTRADDRFRLTFGAFAALDMNYHLTEGISLGAGPVWSTNFVGAGGTVPVGALSELGGTFRLLFTLPERERKAP